VDTEIEMQTEEKIEPWCNTTMEMPVRDRPTHPDEVAKPIREAISAVMNEGKIHGCHDCGEERPAVKVDFTLVCPECHSKNITCIEGD
jgi:Zn finger protein HypA/HybF involved in hydrogenase expression